MRSWLGSIAAHAGAIALFVVLRGGVAKLPVPQGDPLEVELYEPPPPPPPPPTKAGGLGGPKVVAKLSHQPQRVLTTHESAWAIASVHTEEVGRPEGGEIGGEEGGVTCDCGCVGGDVRAPPPPPPPPPPAPVTPPSKARPAKLTYPMRDADVDDDHLFVARITVDRDGSVIGAHLVKGTDLPRASAAADAIWRFHFAPALDDRGEPIVTTFEQPFQLQ